MQQSIAVNQQVRNIIFVALQRLLAVESCQQKIIFFLQDIPNVFNGILLVIDNKYFLWHSHAFGFNRRDNGVIGTVEIPLKSIIPSLLRTSHLSIRSKGALTLSLTCISLGVFGAGQWR